MTTVPIPNANTILNNSLVIIFKFNATPNSAVQNPIFYIGSGTPGVNGIDVSFGPALPVTGNGQSPTFSFAGYIGGSKVGTDTGLNPVNTSYTYAITIETYSVNSQMFINMWMDDGTGWSSFGGADIDLTPLGADITAQCNVLSQITIGSSPNYTANAQLRIKNVAYFQAFQSLPSPSDFAAMAAVINTASSSPYLFGATEPAAYPCIVTTSGGSPNYSSNGVLISGSADQVTITDYIESLLACFTASSKILTPIGYKAAQEFKDSDNIITADGRTVSIKVYKTVVTATKETAPYFVPKNSLAAGIPANDMRLSPWHAIQLAKGKWMKPASAAELNPGSVTQYAVGTTVTYYHFETPNYFTDNLICDGTVVESFSGNQLKNIKQRMYKFNDKLQAYTRLSAPKKTITL